MASLTYKLEKLMARRLVADLDRSVKAPTVKVDGVPYEILTVLWGGSSPRVCLIHPGVGPVWKTAAEWTRLKARF